MDKIFVGLNEKQVEAVKAIEGPVLVISGPGSGKTRCLTHRVAYLISQGVPAENILAVTFTNKAAGEIKERVAKLLGTRGKDKAARTPLVGTFHSICLKILRQEIERLGYSRGFTILDADDQQALVKKISAEMEIDTKRFDTRGILSKISKLKTELTWPEQYHPTDFYPKLVGRVYAAYQKMLQAMNAVDFDDLIGLTVKLFREHPEVLKKYQQRFQYILVDEYQDTSHNQYQLVTTLAREHQNLFCIGDDAQSIYMFREADIRNILNFRHDYPESRIVLLEQNYRSTKNIIAAAQAVIANNKNQIPKELWTANDTGDKVVLKETVNERDEGLWIANMLESLLRQRYQLHDIAILYRTHAQSRAIEESLIASGFPYQIIGGIKFYDRKEIKDILAYARFLVNPKDVVAFERIINTPPRGLGASTSDKILGRAGTDLSISLAEHAAKAQGRQASALKEFTSLVSRFQELLKTKSPSTLFRTIMKEISYEAYLERQAGAEREQAETRIENVQELLTVAKRFDHLGPAGTAALLEEIALLQDMDRVKTGDKKVTLMTMHASKGLEFPIVFIVGMEEGLFPHSRSVLSPHELEEERRLCYVAITRAKERLYISFAKFRRIFGSASATMPSRFVGELPQNLIDIQLSEFGGESEIIDYA
ncbi:MAG: UvrD-helicase domain-containing protein [Patescibacteria group bacterium]